MKILFLDQSVKPGGAALCSLDAAKFYCDRCFIGLFVDGSSREQFEQHKIPAQMLTTKAIQVRKDSSLLQGLSSFRKLLSLISRITQFSQNCDLEHIASRKTIVL
jgi:hypothetical protein